MTDRQDLIEGFNLRINNIKYGFTRGFIFKGIQLDSVSKDKSDIVKIDDAAVNINFLYSILKRKIVLDYIEVGNLGVTVSKDFVESLYGDNEKDEINKNEVLNSPVIKVSVDKLKIDRFILSYDGRYNVELSDFYTSIGELGETDNINFKSKLLILNRKLNTNGNITYRKGLIESDVNIKTDEIKIPGLEKSNIPPLLFRSKNRAEFNNRFLLESVIDIKRLDQPDSDSQAGNFELISEYSGTSSVLQVSKLEFNIRDLLKINAHGVINNLNSSADADISGVIKDLNIDKFNDILADNYQTSFDANIIENKFLVTGSVDENTLNISGSVEFDKASVSMNDAPFSVNKARGILDYKYYLISGATGYSSLNLVSNSADTTVFHISNFLLDSELNYRFSNNIYKGVLKLKARSNNFADGDIDLTTDIDFGNDEKPINGEIKSSRIELSKLKFSAINAVGQLENSLMSFGGNLSEIELDADFGLNNIKLDEYNTSINHLHTTTPVNIVLNISKENSGLNQISLKVHNLDIHNISYGSLSAGQIYLDIDSQNLIDDEIPVSIKLSGNTLSYPDYEVLVDKFQVNVEGQLADNKPLNGHVDLISLHYKKYSVRNLTAGMDYKIDELNFHDIKVLLDNSKKLNLPALKISTANSLHFPSVVKIEEGVYSSEFTQDKISGIELDIKKINEDIWKGSLGMKKIRLGVMSADNFISPVEISNTKIRFGKFQTGLYGGKLTGNVAYLNSGNIPVLETDINLYELKFSSENTVHLGNLSLEYSGVLNDENSIPAGKGSLEFKNLYFQDYEEDISLNGSVDLVSHDETMSFENGLIKSGKSFLVNFRGGLTNPLQSNRILAFETNNMNLVEIKEFLNPLIPTFARYGEIEGGMDINIVARDLPQNTTLNGYIDFHNINLKGDPFSTYFNMKALNGKLEFDQSKADEEAIQEVINLHVKNYEAAYRNSLSRLKSESKLPTLSLKNLEYGFFKLENVKLFLKFIKNKIVFKVLDAKLFGGKIYSSGVYNLNGSEDSSSKLYALFRNFSLKYVTDSIPGTEGYITGKFRGLISLKQKNHKTGDLDGLFDFWTFRSSDEERKIGKAFLERLGAKERFFLGSNKSYDKGELHGYIKDGIITFSNLEISNSILGIKDLNIKVNNKRNSISVTQLLSVIRETARRVEKGTIDFEFEK